MTDFIYPNSGVAYLYCNNCGASVYFPDRGILVFDGRFCSSECSREFDLKKTKQHIMRERR